MEEKAALRRQAGARIDRWLTAVERAPKRAARRVADCADLPPEVRADSYYWCDEIFSPGANPHDAEGVRRSVQLATRSMPDLLRHEYAAQGLRLTVTEGRHFLLVQVDPRSLDVLALPQAQRSRAIHRVAEALFRAPGGRALSFAAPRQIDEGTRFSTDADAEPLLLSAWNQRVEGGIRDGRLYFLCYKKTARRVGFAGDERWFDDTFRRAK